MRTVLAGALSGAVWAIAAGNRYALETIWLPAVVVAAASSRLLATTLRVHLEARGATRSGRGNIR
jgi:hypothetical protein